MRLVRPFLEVLREKGLPARSFRFLAHGSADARISAETAMGLLDQAVRLTGDPDIGLRAALHTAEGGYDALEYAAASCPTVRAGLELFQRCFHLFNAAADLRLEQDRGRMLLSLHQTPEMSRPAIDFSMGALYLSYTRWCGDGPLKWEIGLAYPQPESLAIHARLFGDTSRIRFDSPVNGFWLEDSELHASPQRPDPRLHRLLLGCIQSQLDELPQEESISQRTRRMILEELATGDPSASHIAERLGVSRRTLTRMLEEEGTSFKSLLGDVRCGLSLHYLITRNLGISDIVSRLGYSEPAAFHKAFKRWFGSAPIEYLRGHRVGQGG